MKRDLLSLADLGAPGLRAILETSAQLERLRGTSLHPSSLAGLTVALLFDLPSTRTRISHCLPAHHGEEIDADVIDGPGSLVWDAIAARLHTAKAALVWAAEGRVAFA